MSSLEERRKRGKDLLKKLGKYSDSDKFDAANDAIVDVLLTVAETQQEAEQILRGAEMDFRCLIETEKCAEEG